MTKSNVNAYEVYRLYAYAKNRYTDSFMRTGSLETFHNRRDVGTFARLVRFFKKNEIVTKKSIDLFFALNAKRLGGDFYPHNLVTVSSLECYKKGKAKYGDEESYLHFVFQSFKTINDYCSNNNIKVEDYFKDGRIPQAIKDLKKDKIAEDLIVYSRVINPTKAKIDPLLSVFAKDFLRKYSMIKDRIDRNPKLEKILAKGFAYLLKEQKRRNYKNKMKNEEP